MLASALAMVAIAIAACGTTVPASQIPQGDAGSAGLTVGTTPGTAQGGDGSASAGPGSVSGDVPTRAGAGAALADGVAAGSPNGAAGPSSGSTSAGTARGPIKIGALTAQGAGKFQSSLGFKGATGDQVAMTQSIVDYINARGGFGGRKIELVSYDLDPASAATNESSAAEAACTYFTQDHKVAVVASLLALLPENFYRCLAKAHVPLVTPDEGVSREFFQRYANSVYMPSGPSYTRLLDDSVDALWKAGWLTPKSTVGIVGYDTVDVHAIVDRGLVPALQRHGLKLAAGMYTGTTTAAASEYNSGVLTFRSKHVDRVFFAPGGQPIYFALAAEQQNYHPHYELGSLEYPTVLAANLPADQLSGSMGLSWLPYMDLPSSAWHTVTTPGIAECRKAMAKAGQDFSSGTTLGIAAWICDDWMFLRQVFAAGASPDEAGIRRAAEALGAAFKPTATFRTTLSAGRTHDGASQYRLIAFQDGCKCYKYVSAVRLMR
jgi:ABC-type branched-subunit amino acid transport system substrate-binding protein